MRLYFASGNEHKKMEMERLLGNRVSLVLPKEENIVFDPDENADSCMGNSLIKAKALYSIVHAPVIADDSGLFVRALEGEPGIRSARYGEVDGRRLSDSERYMLLLERMKGIEDRTAFFLSSLTLILSEERFFIVQEACYGKIAKSPSGTNGFGYDPVFLVDEAGVAMAELKPEEKDMYSHRGKAARKMKRILEEEI